MKKTYFYTEISYVCGIIGLALGTALMAKADFGVSMVVAPSYLLYLKLSQMWDFVTFGLTEYIMQALLLLCIIMIRKKFKFYFLLSFVTTMIYGFILNTCMIFGDYIPAVSIASRLVLYIIGLLLCVVAVAFMFHTYFSPSAYELFVKEVSAQKHVHINRFKTLYDYVSCLIGIILSFVFFGFFRFEGVKIGTIVCALVNGKLIGLCSDWMEKHWEFHDLLPWRRFFQSAD